VLAEMAQLAQDLLRTVARFFYTTEHILVIEALLLHSTLPDNDLAHVLGMQTKHLRKLCGRLKEDGLLSVQTRSIMRTDGSGTFMPNHAGEKGKERYTHKDWYYLNYHHAIDSIKFRMHRLNKYIESLGASTTEKKDLTCPRCKAQWTELEAMDKIDYATGAFLCRRCEHALDPVEEDERANENESMKRLNSQLEKILTLMQKIDSSTVPENDWETAKNHARPIARTDAHPGQRTEVVDLPDRNAIQGSKGLAIEREKISVQLQNDEDVKREAAAEEERLRKEKEARQNALPDWIAKSTVSGDITAVGAKEEKLRRELEAHGAVAKEEDTEEKKPVVGGDEDVMAAYWAEMEKAKEQERAQHKADEEEEEDEEDDFEDVDVGSTTPAVNGTTTTNTGANTPALESSNATDDERDAKRVKVAPHRPSTALQANGTTTADSLAEKPPEGTPAASDADDDELEFEDV